MKSHTRAPSPLHCLQLLQGTSEQGPASHGSPPNTNRHSPRHLHQDTLVAGLGCDFVPSHTRVSAPSGQSWWCHFVSALRLVLIFFTSDIHYFHIKT